MGKKLIVSLFWREIENILVSEFSYHSEIQLKSLEVKEMVNSRIASDEKIQVVVNIAFNSTLSENEILAIYDKAFRLELMESMLKHLNKNETYLINFIEEKDYFSWK